jgi:glyoxylase-like metal-dependent hydrolase (beta-lactamase superfamily II)
MAAQTSLAMRIEQLDSRITWIALDDLRSSWLIQDQKNMLIETGYPSNLPDLVKGLEQVSLTPRDIDFVGLTHIHIDHAGGAGYLARQNPALKVFVYETGAGHLNDPSRLVSSVKRAYGNQFGMVGEMVGVAEDQIIPVDTGATIDLGNSRLEVYYTPGHAKHHVVYFDPTSKSVFTGDALGSKYPSLPNFVLSPPADYDRELAKQSIDRIQALHPKRINFTHLGPYNVDADRDFYEHLKAEHDLWNDCIEEIVKRNRTIEPEDAFSAFLEKVPRLKQYPNQFFSFRLSVKGILIYLQRNGKI